MANFFKKVKAITKAAIKAAKITIDDYRAIQSEYRYIVNNVLVVCYLCNHNEFTLHSSIISRSTFDNSFSALECMNCGLVQIFGKTPEKLPKGFRIARLQINSESLAQRCDVCHQVDCFDPKTSYCSRCSRKS